MINKKSKLYNQSKAKGNFLFRMFMPFYSNFRLYSRPHPHGSQQEVRKISQKKGIHFSVYLFNIYFIQLYSIHRGTQWKQTIIMCKQGILSRLKHLRGSFDGKFVLIFSLWKGKTSQIFNAGSENWSSVRVGNVTGCLLKALERSFWTMHFKITMKLFKGLWKDLKSRMVYDHIL